MKITFRKRDNQVIMLGQATDNEALASATVQKDPRMEQGYQMYYEDGKIRYEKSPWMVDEEKKKDMEKMKQDLQSATTVAQLKTIISKLL